MALLLVVDDDEDMQTLVESLLRPAGHTVSGARTALRGLELCASGNPDLILLDLNLPEMNGFSVLQKLKADEQLSNTPVIVLTAVKDKESIVRATRLGAVGYIAKPFKGPDFCAKVESALSAAQGRSYRHSADVQRRFNRTIIAMRNTLPRAVAESVQTLTEGFLQRTRHDAVVLDLTALQSLEPGEVPLLDGLLERIGPERCAILSGRHTGAIMGGSRHGDTVPCFITRGDLDEYLQEEKK